MVYLGSKSGGIPGEKGALFGVVNSKVKHDYSFESNAESAVGISPVLEGVNIGLNSLNLYSLCDCSFSEQLWLVDSLGSRDNLLSSHEHIIGISQFRILLVKHGVERSCWNWVLMQDVEICLVFLLDDLAKLFLNIGWDVLGGVLVDSILFKKLAALLES